MFKKRKFFTAVKSGDLATIEKLVESGFEIQKLKNISRAIGLAIYSNHANVIEYFMEQNLSLNETDEFGYTPLHQAVDNGKSVIVSILLEYGVEVNTKGVDEITPLMTACYEGHYDICKLLINAGADVNAKLKGVDSAYNVAKRGGFNNICELLEKHGAVGGYF